jgi:hypothetical protein
MKALILPERFGHIEKVDNLLTGWDSVKLAIRPEYRDDRSIERAKTAIDAGLNDAAINYIWNLAIFDLQKKIFAYGVDYFASAINWEGERLRTIEDLRGVNDYQLISGAFALGIIPTESHFFLQQCREIRNNFSTAHFPMGDLDKLETFNFIKNCIKYVLTFDLPAPGLQIRDLVESISVERLDRVEELNAIIESQSTRVHGPILHNLFASFIKEDCDPILKHNIKLLAPHLWEIVSDEVKSNIATKFASLRDIPGKDAAGEALAFLKIVNGVEFIPDTFKEIIFKKHAQALIDAHSGWDNFSREPSYARDLASLGGTVPLSVMYTYVKAILLSFVGNKYGSSHAAQEYNTRMISDLSQSGVRTLFSILVTDIDVIREIMNGHPASRLIEVMDLIKEKTMLPKQQELYDIFTTHSVAKLQSFFSAMYWKLVNK